MAVTNLATGIEVSGVTDAVEVPSSRCYVVQATATDSPVQVQGSLDGINFFDMSGFRLSNSTGWASRFLDQPVSYMRVAVLTYGGTPFDVNVKDA